MANMPVEIINVYSNDPLPNSEFIGDHGNGFIIRDGKETIMVDVGTKADILLHNMKKLGISPDQITKLVLTHGHYDHTRALPGFLDARQSSDTLQIYAHPDVGEPKRLKLAFIKKDISLPKLTQAQESKVEWNLSEDPQKITESIRTTGEIKNRPYKPGLEKRAQHKNKNTWELDPLKDDISIYIRTENGNILITGCAHAGLLNISQKIKELEDSDAKITAILGGSHMARYSEDEVEKTGQILKEKFDSPILYLNHCTDRLPLKIIKATPSVDILKGCYEAADVERCFTGSKYTF